MFVALLSLALLNVLLIQPDTATAAFEAAEIHPNKTGGDGRGQISPAGRVELKNTTLKALIETAWNLDPNRVTGGPAWLSTERFDLIAKAQPNSGLDQIRLMLRALLADQFALMIHHEQRPATVYELSLENGGPKLPRSADPQSAPGCTTRPGPIPQTHLVCQNLTMSQFAGHLRGYAASYIDAPVVDRTSLAGVYDFRLDYISSVQYDAMTSSAASSANDLAVSLYDALRKLGLRLSKAKQPMDSIVIDSATHPKE